MPIKLWTIKKKKKKKKELASDNIGVVRCRSIFLLGVRFFTAPAAPAHRPVIGT